MKMYSCTSISPREVRRMEGSQLEVSMEKLPTLNERTKVQTLMAIAFFGFNAEKGGVGASGQGTNNRKGP